MILGRQVKYFLNTGKDIVDLFRKGILGKISFNTQFFSESTEVKDLDFENEQYFKWTGERGRERKRERGGTDRLYLTMCPLLWLELHRWHPASWLGHVWTFRGQCSSGLPPESWNSEQTGPWHRLWIGQSAAGKMEAPHWILKKKLKLCIVLNETQQILCPLGRIQTFFFKFKVLNKLVKYFQNCYSTFVQGNCAVILTLILRDHFQTFWW